MIYFMEWLAIDLGNCYNPSVKNRKEEKSMIHILLAVIYLAFISLGLPDGLLGAGWPAMYPELGVPVSWSGVIFLIISIGTVVSSLLSDRLIRRFGTGRVTAVSVAMTAGALLGFSLSHSFWLLCLLAVPYGLGAGSVDAALNTYVALHYESRHMSWLHCMWGIGASTGPYIMSAVLTSGQAWNRGYLVTGLIQVVLAVFLFCSLSLWKEREQPQEAQAQKSLSFGQALRLPGAAAVILTFFCYCAMEQTIGLWASSYLVMDRGLDEETAAAYGSMYYLGITLGRFLSGFIATRLGDKTMVRLGMAVTALGILPVLLPLGTAIVPVGFLIAGIGSGPIYPSIIHATPTFFGPENAQSLVGMQMSSAYLGICLMPPLFGVLVDGVGIGPMPICLLAVLGLMALLFEKAVKKTQ